MSATTTEATNASNLTLKRASQKLGLATPYRLLSSWWPSFKHYSLLDFIEQEPRLAIEWQAALNRPLLIITRNPPKKAVQLAFDGRLWHRGGSSGGASQQDKDDDKDNPTSPLCPWQMPPPPDPVCWIISSATGKILSEKDCISQLPRRRRLHFFSSFSTTSSSSSYSSSCLLPPPTPLWQLLNLETPFPDPQTWQELNARTMGIAVSIYAGGFCIVDQPAATCANAPMP